MNQSNIDDKPINLVLGDFYEPEKLENENKAFHLFYHSLTNVTDDEIFKIVETGKWSQDFTKIVETNLLEFIYHKFPKYMICYFNAGIDGVIHLGIDDTSEITGVPIIGEIPKKRIEETIIRSIKNNIKISSDEDTIKISSDEDTSKVYKLFLEKCFELEFIPLEIDQNVLSSDSDNYYQSFSKDIIEYNDQMEEWEELQTLFLLRLRKYTQKLENILNKTKYRLELKEFIQGFPDKSDRIIKMLEGDSFIKLETDNIYLDRENRDRVFYWVTKFRNLKSKEILKTRPLKPAHPSIYHPRQILANLPCMRLKFIQNNPGLKFYLIKITCRVENLNKNKVGYFLDNYSKKWITRTRINGVLSEGPSCI